MATENLGPKRIALKVKNKEDLLKQLESVLNCEGKKALMGKIEHIVCEKGQVIQYDLSKDMKKQQKPESESSEDEGMDPCGKEPKMILSEFSYCEFLTAKDTSNVSFEEFITAAHKWGANADGATADDLRGYLAHLGFISSKAASQKYSQQVHLDYDKAIRIQAEEIGWSAFRADNSTAEKLYYGTVNSVPIENVADEAESDTGQCQDEHAVMPGDTSSEEDIVGTRDPEQRNTAVKIEDCVEVLEKDTQQQSSPKNQRAIKNLKRPEASMSSRSSICHHCGKKLSCPSKLRAHLRYHERKNSKQSHFKTHQSSGTRRPRPKKHLCSDCGKQFESPSSLEKHLRRHTGERPFPCTECGNKFISAETLKLHMNIHTGEKRYICSYCGKQFLSSGSLSMHVRMHTGERPHLCSYCGKGFRGSGALKTHMRCHTGEKPHKCSECGKGFSNSTNLARHMLLHTGENPFKCPHCSKTCKQRANLNVHIRSRHADMKPKALTSHDSRALTSSDPCICSFCGKLFKQLRQLKIHMTIHTGRPFSCTECGKGFATASNLKIHARVHTGEKPYTCTHCGKGFGRSAGLDIHIINHHSEKKPFLCAHCGKGFATAIGMQAHARTHTGEKPFVCAICSKGFNSQTNLARHNLVHSGEKPFTCSYCGKGFGQKANQQLHEKIHTGEKPFVCSECGKGFSRAADLRKHMKVHGGATIVTEQTIEISAVDLLADYEAPLHI